MLCRSLTTLIDGATIRLLLLLLGCDKSFSITFKTTESESPRLAASDCTHSSARVSTVCQSRRAEHWQDLHQRKHVTEEKKKKKSPRTVESTSRHLPEINAAPTGLFMNR